MSKLTVVKALVALGLLSLIVAPVLLAAEADDQGRRDKILANLKLKFPQLASTNVTVSELEPSPFEGLDQGMLTVQNQNQKFLVSSDDTKLYLVAGEPVDVSRSLEEIEVELDKREEEKARQSEMRRQELESSLDGLPVRGNPDGAVTIVEFSDFQCPYCARGAETMEQVLAKYPDDVKFVFKHFPLDFHPWAKPAAIAAHCAGLQNGDAFWTLHDEYFENQGEITPDNVVEKSKEFLGDTGIDMEKWANCAVEEESEAYKEAAALVDADMSFGKRLGVSGTPGFFVNGQFINGAQPLSAFEPLIAAAVGAE